MQRERVTEHIYIFTSDLYVQVTAGVVVTSAGAIVIDTLLYPEETLLIKRFVEDRLGLPIRYVINTHHHADHTMGTCFFSGAEVIAHRLCRTLLDTRGRESLTRTKTTSKEMAAVELVLPHITFDERMSLRLGDKTLHLWHTPGHSPDTIVVQVEEDQVLFGSDIVMPIPYFVDGSLSEFMESLKQLRGLSFDTIIQGHGEVMLRGEVEAKLKSDMTYLEKLQTAVDKALTVAENKQERALEAIKIEACGKSPVLLQGAVRQLHRQNVMSLAAWRREQMLLHME